MQEHKMVEHKNGDNTPCDDASRCADYKSKYRDEVKAATKPRKFIPEGYKGQYDFGAHDPNKTMEDAENMFEYSQTNQEWRDYHAINTIVFGELIDGGFDWGKTGWPCYTEEIRARLISLIEETYRFREICEAPPAKFKSFIVRKLRMIMPKYNKMYELLANDRFDILEAGQHYKKDRDVFSEYPQAQLQGTTDYASNATDRESKGKTSGNVIDMMNNYAETYRSIDERVVRELEVCFYSTTSGTINSF